MHKFTPGLAVIFLTLLAAVAVRDWALAALEFSSSLPMQSTISQVVRHDHPIRIIQPEWVNNLPSRLVNWSLAETLARFSFIFVLWLLSVGVTLVLFGDKQDSLRKL